VKSVYFTAEHDAFRRDVRRFLEAEIAPQAEAWEEARRIPRSAWKRLGELGYLGICFPEELGGQGADLFFALAFLEELPRSRTGGFCAAVSVQEFIATGAIHRHGTRELTERFLAPSIRGEKVGAIAISEPDTGSDVAAIRTSAVRDGEAWVVNGAKTWITNGVHGDFYVVAVKTDRDAGAGGITLLAMDADLPGIRTSKLRKMGWHSSDTAEIVFEDVRVPVSGTVGRVNRGFFYIMETFALERLVTASISVGSALLALEVTRDYMEKRHAFGKPISRFQALRHRYADLSAELEAVRQLTYHTAWLIGQGEPAVRESSMCKLLATELNKKTADECLQFFGGYGTVEEYPMERFYRDARFSTIVAGTSEIMREIVARTDVDGVVFGKVAADDDEEADEADDESSPGPPETIPVATATMAAGPIPATIEGLLLSLPGRFRPEKVESFSARVHFRFKGAARPEWTVTIAGGAGGACEVSEGHSGTPDGVVTTTAETWIGIETGSVNPQTAFLLGKLKVSNVVLLTRFVKAFRPAFPR
jgi:alkylation response protein AidB-like acyl-CoA dehydrogenase